MINPDDTLQIGYLKKPYGIKGEITIVFDKESYADIDTDFYFLDIDGILVPFFPEEITFVSDTMARVKWMDIDNETMAARYANLSVHLPRQKISVDTPDETLQWDFFIGYAVIQEDGNKLGIIRYVNTDTINVLLVLENGDKEILIPATEDFIDFIDYEKKEITMQLPEGLLDI